VDIWACGCILAEMFTKTSLFQGYNTLDQISKISKVRGTPSETALAKIPNRKARHYLSKLPKQAAPPLAESLGTTLAPDAAEIILKMLEWDPDMRPTCTELLEFEYVAELHEVEDEPSRDTAPFDLFEYERRKVSVDFLLEELFHELLHHQTHSAMNMPRQYKVESFDPVNPNPKSTKPGAAGEDDADEDFDEDEGEAGDPDRADDLGLHMGLDVSEMRLSSPGA
jgi:serine/threonine protein kinase